MGSNATDKEKYRFGDKFVEKIIRRIALILKKLIRTICVKFKLKKSYKYKLDIA